MSLGGFHRPDRDLSFDRSFVGKQEHHATGAFLGEQIVSYGVNLWCLSVSQAQQHSLWLLLGDCALRSS